MKESKNLSLLSVPLSKARKECEFYMIDIKRCKDEFTKYTNKFNQKDENIKRKFLHSFRVMNISKRIASNLKLSKEEQDLASLIGLLHDIGRFEQQKTYKTFKDLDSVDHGLLGTQILKNENFIRNFIQDESYDNIILKAIYNHNKFKIEEDLNDKELLFSKIIRDADKIDILFEGTNIFWKNEIELINNGKIQDSVYNQIIRNETIERTKGRKIELIDKVISVLAFVFDINFNESLEIINKNDYINKILRRFDFKDKETIEKIEEISKVINNYIQERTNKG